MNLRQVNIEILVDTKMESGCDSSPFLAVDMKNLNTSKRGVLMIGTAIGDRGGIGSVVAILRDSGLFDRNHVEYIATHREGTAAQKIALAVSAWCKCFARLIMGRIYCFHVHLASRASFWRKLFFVLPAYLFRIPVILHLHGAEFHLFYERECGAIRKWCIRTVFQQASAVVALSDSWVKWLRDTFIRVNAVVIYNPVTVPPESKVVRDVGTVLFLGRLGERKGTFVLLKAVSLLSSAGIAVRLWLGGDGDIDAIRKCAADLGIAERVELLGWVSGDRKSRLLNTAGIYCLPSFNEGLPISLLEAMASGMSVVTTPVGGIPEAVSDGAEGYLVAPGDAEALAEKLRDLIRNPELAEHMGSLGRRKVIEQFAAEVIVPKVEALYGSFQ
ncbi:MAG: glycosyltransferase family 4 protein [Rhodobacteraceae bacterium]|nr:glycosyltransferase family 4 protein [Paracoccaceae bacterium]